MGEHHHDDEGANAHEMTIREKVRSREVVMELGGRSEIPYIYMYMGGLYQKRATLKTMRVILV